MTAPVVAALLLQIETALRQLADTLQAVPMRAHMVDQFALLGSPRLQVMRCLPG